MFWTIVGAILFVTVGIPLMIYVLIVVLAVVFMILGIILDITKGIFTSK